MTEQYISVGKFGKPHGLSGAFRFYFFAPLKNKSKFPAHLMIFTKGNYIPWFVKKVEMEDNESGRIEFEGVSTPEIAKTISGKEFFLTENEATKFFKEETGSIEGYTAIDDEQGELGVIVEIVDNSAQDVCVIKSGNREILIPLVEEFIVNIDTKKKTITFSLPEGLLDL